MTRCRASTFYLAPGIYRSFDDYAIYTNIDGTWVELTHRKDVERLDANGTWDGQCHVVHRHHLAERDIEAAIKTTPELVERWKLCTRTINGRRPAGHDHMLHKIANNGAAHTGGIKACVGQILGAGTVGKRCARWFENQPEMPPSVQATALKFLQHARSGLDDNEMQSLIAAMERTRCVAPMPEFAYAQVRDLTFLQRWPSQTRVKLLADLWNRTTTRATASYLRIADEMLTHIHPAARQRGQQTLEHIVTCSPRSVLAAIRDDEVGNISNLPLNDDIISELAATPRFRHTVALHPAMRNGQTLQTIADSGGLERHSINAPNDTAQLADDLLDTIEKLLTSKHPAHITHSHSLRKAENMFVLAVTLARRRPEAAHHVAIAFATWTRCRGAQNDGGDWAIREVIGSHNLTLDTDTINRLWKSAHELALQRQRLGQARHPNYHVPFHRNGISELASLLEQQAATPPALREHATQWCRDNGLEHRDNTGSLVSGHQYRAQLMDNGDAAGIIGCIETPDSVEERTRLSDTVIKDAAIRGVDDELWDQLATHHATTVQQRVANTWATTRAIETEACRKRLETLDAARRIIRGTISEEDLALHGDDVARNTRVSWYHSNMHAITPHTRKWMLEQNSDSDLLLLENALHGRTAVVTAQHLGDLEASLGDVQTLHERNDVVWPDKPKRFSDLPDFDTIEWNLTDDVQHLQGRQIVVGADTFTVRVIDNYHELKNNAAPNNMGNCTASYAREIRQGNTLMLALQQHGRTEINVSLQAHTGDGTTGWSVEQIKGRQDLDLGNAMNDTITAQLIGLLPRAKRARPN